MGLPAIFAKAKKMFRRILSPMHVSFMPFGIKDRQIIADTAAYMSVDFIACILAKSQPLASLPIKIYERDVEGRLNRIKHPLDILLTKRWNPWMTAFAGWNWLVMRRDVFGQAAIRVKWDSKGEPVAFYPVSSRVSLLFDQDTNEVMYEVVSGDDFTPAGRYLSHEILIFKTPVSQDGGITGTSLAKVAATEVGLSIDLNKFYSRLLNNGNHFPGYLETDEDLDDQDKAAIVEALRETSGVDNVGTIRIFDKGLKYRQNPMTMGDMSLIDMQTWVLQQCCRITGVPPAMVHENSRSTYTNVASMRLQFAQNTLTNEARSIEQSLQVLLDAMAPRFPNCEVRFDLNGYLRGDYRTRIEGYRTGVYAGFFTRAEVRDWEELPPIEGLDEPLQPTAYYPVRDGEPYEPNGTSNDTDDKAVANAMEPVLDDMRKRIKERFIQNGDSDKTRNFARVVLEPYAQACSRVGMIFDVEMEIERLLHV